jgi:nucleoside-diphosphate-sugar epimerase
MRILTTGILSGLGKYLHENLGGISLTRATSPEDMEKIKKEGVDVIIHCAFNSRRGINSDSLYHYLEDNVLLTEKLVFIPHKKFIFLSSVDVYPKKAIVHSEDEIIDVDSINGIYGITKLMSESIVKNHCENYLILRGTALLGKYTRKNSLIKIIEDEECILTLADDSRFNYVLHSDILDFIKFSIDHDLVKGIYNLASSENVTLSEVANMLGKKVKFGTYLYDVGNIDNSKISSVFPAFKKTSKEIVTQFIGDKT